MARIDLAIVLVAAAAGIAYAGTRLRRPVRLPKPGQTAMAIMVLVWVFAITAFLACAHQYVSALRQHHLLHGLPSDPITPVTGACVVVIFVMILIVARSYDGPVRLASAAIGAIAAPMLFELPFDLIVMARTRPPVPPDPAVYRVLFFAPLLLVELATLSFLTFAPMVRLTRATFFSFALMLAVFAVWALSGFGYPATPGPLVFNVLSKILAFATALTLFLPPRSTASTSPSAARPGRDLLVELLTRRQAAELGQLQAERLEPGDHAVHRGLVWQAARQQRVLAARLRGQGRERAQHLRPEMAADADLVVPPLRIALLAGHLAPSVGSGWRTKHCRAMGERSSHRVCHPLKPGSFQRCRRVGDEYGGW
jgi:hypothetical protein